MLSVELHVRTRRSLRPDPEFDVICAIFYHIENETKDGKKYETGVIVTLREMTKIRNPNDDVCQVNDILWISSLRSCKNSYYY